MLGTDDDQQQGSRVDPTRLFDLPQVGFAEEVNDIYSSDIYNYDIID